MGSGSTIAAATFLGLRSIGLEQNKTNYLMALKAIPCLSRLSLNSNGSGNLKLPSIGNEAR